MQRAYSNMRVRVASTWLVLVSLSLVLLALSAAPRGAAHTVDTASEAESTAWITSEIELVDSLQHATHAAEMIDSRVGDSATPSKTTKAKVSKVSFQAGRPFLHHPHHRHNTDINIRATNGE